MLETNNRTKECPFCAEIIKFKAIKCKHCGSMIDDFQKKILNSDNSNTKMNLKSEIDWFEEGNCCLNSEEYDEAINKYNLALKENPEFALAWNNMGAAYGHLGKSEKAIKCYKKAVAIDEKLPIAWDNLGLLLLNKKEYEEAMVCFKKAISYDKDNGHYWNHQGNVFITPLKDYKKALVCFQRAVELLPDFSLAWNNLAFAHQMMKDNNKALECYNKAIKLDPNLEIAKKNMKNLLEQNTDNSDNSKIQSHNINSDDQLSIETIERDLDKCFKYVMDNAIQVSLKPYSIRKELNNLKRNIEILNQKYPEEEDIQYLMGKHFYVLAMIDFNTARLSEEILKSEPYLALSGFLFDIPIIGLLCLSIESGIKRNFNANKGIDKLKKAMKNKYFQNSGGYMFLGQLYFMAGKKDEAKKHLNKAINLEGGNTELALEAKSLLLKL